MLQAAHFLLKSYNSWVHKWEWLPHYHQAKEKNELQLHFYFFLFLINVCVFSFFFLKVAERYLGHVTKSPIIYIYIYIFFFFFFFTINQSLLKITKLKLYNLEHPPWSHISYDQVRPQFTKPFQFVNKAPLSKLMSYLIYISPNPNETWSISFAKSSTSSSIVLRLLLMCGCSNTTICYWNLFFMTTIINKQS